MDWWSVRMWFCSIHRNGMSFHHSHCFFFWSQKLSLRSYIWIGMMHLTSLSRINDIFCFQCVVFWFDCFAVNFHFDFSVLIIDAMTSSLAECRFYFWNHKHLRGTQSNSKSFVIIAQQCGNCWCQQRRESIAKLDLRNDTTCWCFIAVASWIMHLTQHFPRALRYHRCVWNFSMSSSCA